MILYDIKCDYFTMHKIVICQCLCPARVDFFLYRRNVTIHRLYTAKNRVMHDINIPITGGVARRMSECLGSVAGF